MSKLLALVRSIAKSHPITCQLIRTFGECCTCHNETVVVTQVSSDGSHTEHSPMVCKTCFDLALLTLAVKEVLQ